MPTDHKTLRDQTFQAIAALPRPITSDHALEAARPLLPKKEFAEFEKWLAQFGGGLLGRLNG